MTTPLERCPDCGRFKAHSADDCLHGMCSKWYAVRDQECEQECLDIKRFHDKRITNQRLVPFTISVHDNFVEWSYELMLDDRLSIDDIVQVLAKHFNAPVVSSTIRTPWKAT